MDPVVLLAACPRKVTRDVSSSPEHSVMPPPSLRAAEHRLYGDCLIGQKIVIPAPP